MSDSSARHERKRRTPSPRATARARGHGNVWDRSFLGAGRADARASHESLAGPVCAAVQPSRNSTRSARSVTRTLWAAAVSVATLETVGLTRWDSRGCCRLLPTAASRSASGIRRSRAPRRQLTRGQWRDGSSVLSATGLTTSRQSPCSAEPRDSKVTHGAATGIRHRRRGCHSGARST